MLLVSTSDACSPSACTSRGPLHAQNLPSEKVGGELSRVL